MGSADAAGRLAPGSSFGARHVDLLVPAEELVSIDFNGYARLVSGSSHAAARVSALAACFKAAHPEWGAGELRAAIFALAVPSPSVPVAVGVLPEPRRIRRGACAPDPAEPVRIGELALEAAALYPDGEPADARHVLAPVTLVWLDDAGWTLEAVTRAAAGAADVYRQCRVRFGPVRVELWRVPRALSFFHTGNAQVLMRRTGVRAPAAWFVRDTLQQPAFDAEAIGRSNARTRPSLMNTVWLTAHLEHPGIALAHELYHVLANTGSHVPETDNLMHADTAPERVRLTDWQCDRMREVGAAFGLLEALPEPGGERGGAQADAPRSGG